MKGECLQGRATVFSTNRHRVKPGSDVLVIVLTGVSTQDFSAEPRYSLGSLGKVLQQMILGRKSSDPGNRTHQSPQQSANVHHGGPKIGVRLGGVMEQPQSTKLRPRILRNPRFKS